MKTQNKKTQTNSVQSEYQNEIWLLHTLLHLAKLIL